MDSTRAYASASDLLSRFLEKKEMDWPAAQTRKRMQKRNTMQGFPM